MGYQIQHINLKESLPVSLVTSEQKQQYIVLWWDNLPLGDFYIEQSDKTNDDFIKTRIINSIKRTVNNYTGKTEEEWMPYLLQNDYFSFQRWMVSNVNNEIIENLHHTLPVSVVICTRNRATLLSRCLQSLTSMQFTAAEIIVVDNASDNDDTKNVTARFSKVKYVKEPRKGLDIARNTGIKSATSDIVAFIDDDAEAHPYWIFRIWEIFRDESIAAQTGLVFPLELNTTAQILFEKYWTFNRGYIQKIYDGTYIKKNAATGAPVWEIGAGVNMAFRRQIFAKVGQFDELLDAGAAGCNGDSEMWFRILANGYKICYNPKAVVFHEHRGEMEKFESQIFNYMKGNTAAALIQQSYHPASNYRKYISKTLKKKARSLTKRIITGNWNSSKILRLELKGLFAGIIYYYKTK